MIIKQTLALCSYWFCKHIPSRYSLELKTVKYFHIPEAESLYQSFDEEDNKIHNGSVFKLFQKVQHFI